MTLNLLLTIWAVSLFLALLALAVVARPLWILLVDMCGTSKRARFWTLYASVLTVATPLLTVSMPGLLDGVAASAQLGPVLQRTVFYSLVGIIVALVIMGYAVRRPVAASTTQPPVSEPPAR